MGVRHWRDFASLRFDCKWIRGGVDQYLLAVLRCGHIVAGLVCVEVVCMALEGEV